MSGKWQETSNDEYILKPEFAPANVVATVYPAQGYGKFEARVVNLTTNKTFTTRRASSLATAKRKAQQMANSSIAQIKGSQKS